MNTYIIIPAYNESSIIADVLEKLRPLQHHMVVVDDGSGDDTAAISRQHGATVLRQDTNQGQGAALQTGFEYAREHGAEFMVTFDADGQHQASDIQRLLDALNKHGADVALGSRFLGRAINIQPSRKWALKLLTAYTNYVYKLKLTDVHNGLRAFRVSTTHCIQITQPRMAHASELLELIAMHKLHYVEVPTTVEYTPILHAKRPEMVRCTENIQGPDIGAPKE